MIKKEEALSLLNKWRDDATSIRVVADLASLHLDSDAVIMGCDWNRFALRLPGKENFFDLDFGDCEFNFGLHPKSKAAALVGLRSDGELFFVGDMG